MNITFETFRASTGLSFGKSQDDQREILNFGVRLADKLWNSATLQAGGDLNKLEDMASVIRQNAATDEDDLECRGFLSYSEALEDSEIGSERETFVISVIMPIDQFDRTLRLVQANFLPNLSLDLAFSWSLADQEQTGIRYGSAPDSSVKEWDNRDHPTLRIFGFDLSFPLIGHGTDCAEDVDEMNNPVRTSQYLDRLVKKVSELQAVNTKILSAICFITGAPVVIGFLLRDYL